MDIPTITAARASASTSLPTSERPCLARVVDGLILILRSGSESLSQGRVPYFADFVDAAVPALAVLLDTFFAAVRLRWCPRKRVSAWAFCASDMLT